MSYSKRSRYSRSPSYDRYRGSLSRSLSRSTDVDNPGNNLYVTGLSHRITKRDLEKHFSAEGTVEDVHLVIDPWTRESRGFGFVTMSSVKEAERCIKFLDRSVLEGRVITVEKLLFGDRARRRRGRTPTPGRYCGLRAGRVRHRSSSSSPYGSRSRSPCFPLDRYRSQSRSYSPYYRHRSYLRSSSPYSRSPIRRERPYSPDDRYYRSRRHHARSYRSISRSISRRSYSRSISPLRHRRSYSRSISPPRYRRWYSRSITPRRSRRSYYRSVTPRGSYNRRSRSYYRSISPRCSTGRQYYYSRSRSVSASSRSVSRSVSSRSASPSP